MTTPDLERFIGEARWFGGKGRAFTIGGVRRVGTLGEEGAVPRVALDLVTVAYADGDTDLYQLPLSFRPEADERFDHALVGRWDDPDFGRCFVYDAVHDRDAMAWWLEEFARTEGQDTREALTFHRVGDHELDTTSHSTLFSGEQSNSSVAFGEDSLMKVFRRVTPGVNPDIQVHEVLTAAGSEHVAALHGWLDTYDADSDAVIQLAMLQQFLRTASDGWELAQASVRNLMAEADLHADEVGGDFAGESERLGIALAEVHADLAEHFPTETRSGDALRDLAVAMDARLSAAIDVVPGLAEHRNALHAVFDRVAALGEITVQRVHCDLHLGQTLRTVRGWKIVDFEGEPAKPLAERLLPDSVWRDVAGMLRSYDYAAAVVARTMAAGDDTGDAQRAFRGAEWSERNRRAFVDAYAGRALTADEQTLLAAYEADKAVYECVYEARNRPAWVEIPLAAVARIAS